MRATVIEELTSRDSSPSRKLASGPSCRTVGAGSDGMLLVGILEA